VIQAVCSAHPYLSRYIYPDMSRTKRVEQCILSYVQSTHFIRSIKRIRCMRAYAIGFVGQATSTSTYTPTERNCSLRSWFKTPCHCLHSSLAPYLVILTARLPMTTRNERSIGLARRYLWTALSSVVLIASHACATSNSKSAPLEDPEPQTVTCCDLIAHPERYDKKTVRIRALLDHTDFEKDNLDDVNCVVGKQPRAGAALGKIWVIEPDTTQRAPFGLFDITATGIFYVAPADSPDRYGNCCRFAFQITHLEKSEKLK